MDINKSHATSTPAPRLKTHLPSDPLSKATNDTAHVSGQVQPQKGDSSLTIPVPADVQRVVVEHIVKHDSHPYAPTLKEQRPFSGNFPKPPSEVDYSVWRLRAKQVLNDSALSEGQQRRALLDSLHTPALNVALGIGPQAPPHAYLQELDNAYGNVTGGEELYIQFLETHQNNGERASDYLRRLQALLQEIIEKDGVVKQDAESQLLKQFLRGCWDDSLITALHLKELLSNPFRSTPTFSELLLKIRTHEKESQLKEVRRKRHMGVTPTKVHTKTLVTMGESEVTSSNVSKVPDAVIREQLEERIRQLEAELRKNTSPQTTQRPRYVKDGQRPSNSPKTSNITSPSPLLPTEQRTKIRKFCYNCGEDSHMLQQCTNPPNAVLVQRKLCERHNSRQGQQQVAPQSNLPLNM
uniref:CCHC-type domain-containing protein n=1 Tax=Myripristis murdjan TaxID=586833 RepID=A0A667YFX9_9TELE